MEIFVVGRVNEKMKTVQKNPNQILNSFYSLVTQILILWCNYIVYFLVLTSTYKVCDTRDDLTSSTYADKD